MSKKGVSIQEDITPNLIPMIDIMFLLLLFLMISSDMGQRELEDVILPIAEVVKKDEPTEATSKEGDRVTINVYHLAEKLAECSVYWNDKNPGVCREERHWRIGIKGKDYVDMDQLLAFLDKEAQLGRKGTDPKAPKVSERKVMIRADGAAPYGMPQKVMNICAKAGMYKIDVGAASPPIEGGKKSTH
jgi:biopolymer transport protein ExbD